MKKTFLCLAFALMACGEEEIAQTCGPAPNTYFDSEGNELTNCSQINTCNNPPTVFDKDGDPVACED